MRCVRGLLRADVTFWPGSHQQSRKSSPPPVPPSPSSAYPPGDLHLSFLEIAPLLSALPDPQRPALSLAYTRRGWETLGMHLLLEKRRFLLRGEAATIWEGFRATSTVSVDFSYALSTSVASWVWCLMASASNCLQMRLGNASLPVAELNWTLGLNTELAAVLQTLSGSYCN